MFRFSHHGPLSTVIDVRIDGLDEAGAEAADRAVRAEIERLERVFSAYDDSSELCRWRRHLVPEPGPELSAVLLLALAWQQRSHGLFNPLVGQLTGLWQAAEAAGTEPDAGLLARTAETIREARVGLIDGRPVPVGDCSGFQLNAVAKGWIVDRAVERAFERFAPSALLVGAGGDIRHRGAIPARIGIENPLRPFDNEPPLLRIDLGDAAIATSGPSRRGFRVGGDRHSHIIDPRSGRPVTAGAVGVSVVAAEAATADAAATVASVLAPAEAVAWLDSLDEVAGLVVDRSGGLLPDRAWLDRFGPPGR